MAVLKIEGLRALEAIIECEIADLKGKICLDQSSPGHDLGFPSLSITIEGSKYFPDQEDEHFIPSANAVVLNVGRHVYQLKLRLGAATPYQRAALEQQVLDLFLVTDGHPGVIFTSISSCAELGAFVAAWELEGDEWQDEKVFDRQAYSELEVTGILPALVTRRGVYTIEQLQLGTDIGPSVDPTSAPPAFDSTEILSINEDGTFTPL